ncbi:MAG: hypothetical protein CL610_03900 [Anaerolineaceae bacterium]|nr:hypothetical protein [Anaerolineaceae bacterium]
MPVKYVLLLLALVTVATPAAVGLVNSSQATEVPATSSLPTAPNRQTFAAMQDGDTPPGDFAQTIVIPNENTPSSVTISALGTIEANEVAGVSFLTAGDVAEIAVETGQTVSEGDLLAWLHGTDAQIAYDQAQLSLERARINLDEIYEPPTDSELRVADANIASAQAAYSAAADNSSAVDSAEVRYQQALNTYETAAAVRANMNGTEEEIALQDAAVGAASFNLEIARLQLEEAQNPDTSGLWSAGVRIRQAQLQKEALLAEPTEAEVTSAEIAVQRAEAQVASAETALRRTRVYAPISGVVTAVNVEPGDSVSAGIIVIEISDVSQFWLSALVHEVDVDDLSAGMPATITLDALPDLSIDATVEQISWLSTVEDNIVNYDTRFLLRTTDPRIRVGMTAQAVVEVEG